MALSSTLGVAVVGVGSAGRFRIRDLQENTNGLHLKGFVSRRELDIAGASQLSLKDALGSEDVHAVIICTEPCNHEELARQALDAGKHVLVEYPLALSSSAAASLYKLAADRGLVLHEENVSLLAESHEAWRELARRKPAITAVSRRVGNYQGWMDTLAQGGKPFLTRISAIQALYDVFGDLRVMGASLDLLDGGGFKCCGRFAPKTGHQKLTVIAEHYKETVEWMSATVVEFEDGEVFDSTKFTTTRGHRNPGTGLLNMDLDIFAAKIRGERVAERDVTMSITCLEIAEEANSLLK